jgi:hypothetical protein
MMGNENIGWRRARNAQTEARDEDYGLDFTTRAVRSRSTRHDFARAFVPIMRFLNVGPYLCHIPSEYHP